MFAIWLYGYRKYTSPTYVYTKCRFFQFCTITEKKSSYICYAFMATLMTSNKKANKSNDNNNNFSFVSVFYYKKYTPKLPRYFSLMHYRLPCMKSKSIFDKTLYITQISRSSKTRKTYQWCFFVVCKGSTMVSAIFGETFAALHNSPENQTEHNRKNIIIIEKLFLKRIIALGLNVCRMKKNSELSSFVLTSKRSSTWLL